MSNWQYSTYSKVNPEVKQIFPFEKPRPDQLETISEIKEAIDKGYKYIILEAGTGTGKSVMAATLALMFDSTYILTVTKQLQDQYLKDFEKLDFKVVKGRGNFKCRKYAEDNLKQGCDEGRCVLEGYNCEYSIKRKSPDDISKSNTCEYEYQKWQAMISNVVISNYHYLFLELNYNQDFNKRNFLVCDEAHNLEDTLMSQLLLEFDRKDLKEYVGVNLSAETVKKLNNGNYQDWIEFIGKINEKYKKELAKIEGIRNKPEIANKSSFLKKRIEDCNRFVTNIKRDPQNWIFDYDSYYGIAQFKPIKVDSYAVNNLFKYADTCLFMSATILDYKLFAKWLGIDESEIYAIRRKTPFDISRNPIITDDGFNMTYAKLPSSAKESLTSVKGILDKHKNDKGIIHTVSYQCKNFLKKNLDDERVIDHKTYNRAKQLNKFKKSKKPLVLISPSMNEGVDLPGKLCRFQIIYKIPYPSIADKQTNMRKRVEKQWYDYKTCLSLVQTYGRGMRYENDYCKTYFIDSRIKGYIKQDERTNNFLPDFFKEAVGITPAVIDETAEDDFEIENKMPIKTIDSKIVSDELNDNFDDESTDSSNPDGVISSNFDENVNRKYELTLKGNDLLENGNVQDAIEFYNVLLSHELFIHDYHPYLKLAKAYRKAEQYEDEVDIVKRFFNANIYCRRSTLNWFKKRLIELADFGYFDSSQLDNLEATYKRKGAKKRKLSNVPVPLARDIKSGKKSAKKKIKHVDEHKFDDEVYINENASYDEKVKFKLDLTLKGDEFIKNKDYGNAIAFFKALLGHNLFINDYYPYRKLATAYHKAKQYDMEIDIITRFFKSGIYCDKSHYNWFKRKLKNLNRYGRYDLSKLNDLELEYSNNGALNQSSINQPVPLAIILKNGEDGFDVSEKSFKSGNIKTSASLYNIEYFNNLAEEIENKNGFISDRDLMKHKESDFVPVENYEDINLKADLKQKGKDLEKEDKEAAIEFYNGLKTHKLFINDYYPYRRQCILFKNKLKDDEMDWKTIEELFSSKIYLNSHQLIWLENKIKELKPKLDLTSYDMDIMDDLVESYKLNKEMYEPLQNTPVPIAERIIKDDDGLKLLSQEKYDKIQNLFYVKELGVGYIRRKEYKKAIDYYKDLLNNDFLYYKYHAYKQFARIFREMKNPDEFKRLYEGE